MNFFVFSGANRLDQGSDEDVFNDEASVISNVSSGSLAKDDGEFVYILNFSAVCLQSICEHFRSLQRSRRRSR